MLGARKGSTPLSYGNQPLAQYLYDPVARRAVRYVETVVPTLDLSENTAMMGTFIPSDRYYVKCGAWDSASRVPPWLQNVSITTYQTWDATEEQFYLSNAGGASNLYSAVAPLVYPSGHMGASSPHAPKNATAAAVWIKFFAAFTTNADYGTDGVGANNTPGTAFSTSSHHFIQVLRNSGNWELGSCDGSTISQSASSVAADGSAHAFWVRWAPGELKLYVDQVLVITKTTNIPARPLKPVALQTAGSANIVRLYDYLIEWEIA